MKINELRIRDPYIYAENSTYYLCGTTPVNGKQHEFVIYTSKDLENWSDGKIVFERNDDFWASEEFWAAELHKYDGKYYLFVSFMSQCSQILVCDTPDGRYEPMGDWGITPRGMCCIDGTLYVDKNGQPYMVFSGETGVVDNEWGKLIDRGIFAMPLSKDLKQAVGEPKLLFSGSDCRYTISRGNSNREINYVCEGPFVYRNNNGLYILWSGFVKTENGGRAYMETAAYSDNGEIDGNWKIFETPIYSNDGGHGMIFKTFEGKSKLILHAPNGGSERPLIFDLDEDKKEFSIR